MHAWTLIPAVVARVVWVRFCERPPMKAPALDSMPDSAITYPMLMKAG